MSGGDVIGCGEERFFVDGDEPPTIGARARRIRRRRGMSLDVAAGLVGISKPYLSMLENGQRGFNRRGLVEDIATALGCSVADLTGQPYHLPDRESADLRAAVAETSAALHDTTLTDVPDVPARPLPELVRAAVRANAYADDARYAMAGKGMGPLLTELHVHAVTGSAEERRAALAGLAEACMVAYCLAYRLADGAVAVAAANRGFDAARQAERPDLAGMLAMSRTMALMRVRAQRRAGAVCAETLNELSAMPGPTPEDTKVGEARGILHLTSALVAARDGRNSDVATHLGEARSLAAHTGERNLLRYHFGPTNVAGWELSIALEPATAWRRLNASSRAPSTSRCSAASAGRGTCASCWLVAGRTAHEMTRRCGRWMPLTGWRRWLSVMSRSPVICC